MRRFLNTRRPMQLLGYILIPMALWLGSCSSKGDSTTEPTAELPGVYTLTSVQFSSGDMKLSKLETHTFFHSVKTNGMFEAPPQNKVSVSAYFEGYIKEIDLLPGEKVKKGQILFTLENPSFLQVQQDFLEAKGQLSYLQSDYERQKNLASDNITSQKTYLKAEADFTTTKVRYESLKKKLSLMNINANTLTEENLHTVIPVYSPIHGYVTHVNVDKGVFVNPSDVAISIIDTDHLHLELTIFEKDLASVKIGQSIKFKIQNNEQEYDAFVHLVNKAIDPEKRTVMIHGHLADEKSTELFTPGMYVEAEIYTASTTSLALPQEAIVNIEDQYFVLVKTSSTADDLTFEKRAVEIGMTTNGYTEILNHTDFKSDDMFLSKGAFNLITE